MTLDLCYQDVPVRVEPKEDGQTVHTNEKKSESSAILNKFKPAQENESTKSVPQTLSFEMLLLKRLY